MPTEVPSSGEAESASSQAGPGGGRRQGARLARCCEITMFTHLQLIKAPFVAVLETRSVGSTWLHREGERERDSNCGLRKSKII